MTFRELIAAGEERLGKSGIEDVKSDVRLLLMSAFDMNYTEIFMRLNEAADTAMEKTFLEYIEQRCRRIPCQYITGYAAFMGRDFAVEPGVLIPRPETELLVEKAVCMCEDIPRLRALDLCCGSGCIGLSFVLERRKKGFIEDEIVLGDISEDAIRVTGKNAKRLFNYEPKIVKTDLFSSIDGRFDIIISNPPYISTADMKELMVEVKDYEPELALCGKDDGLYFYKRIIKEAGDYLNDNGKLLFEIGYNQFEDVRRLFVDNGYIDISLVKDYAGLDRIVTGTLK